MNIKNKSVFEFRSYRTYLLMFVGPAKSRTGKRSEIANFLNCKTSYISQVLAKRAHLSIEQAEKLCDYIKFDERSKRFFILLVQRERAGSKNLELFYNRQIDEELIRYKKIISRLSDSNILPEHLHAKYYSSWIYGAVHIAVSIPQLSHREALSKYFNVDLNIISDVVDFLLRAGLIIDKSGVLSVGPVQIHLPDNSEHILRHHTNWRLQALKSFDAQKDGDLHYSVAAVLSKSDAELLYESFMQIIKKHRDITGPSKEETIYCSIIDFFKV